MKIKLLILCALCIHGRVFAAAFDFVRIARITPAIISTGDTLTNSLVQWLRLNESSGTTAADSSGNNNVGTLNNGAAFTGTAVSFDGVNDNISATNSTSLNPTNALTILAIINRSATGKMRVVAKTVTSGSTATPFDFGINTDDTLYFNRASTNQTLATSRVTIPTNTTMQIGVTISAAWFTNRAKVFSATSAGANAAWQGVAYDGTNYYVVSDKSTASLSGVTNRIAKFNAAGTLLNNSNDVYTTTLSGYRFSFGNAHVISNELFVTLYDANARNASTDPNYARTNLHSRIAVYNLSDISYNREYDLGTNVSIAEGIDFYNGHFWVVDGWFDTFSVAEYDTNFTLVANHSLPVVAPFTGELTYQCISWSSTNIFVNWHGDNTNGGNYARGLDTYSWDGSAFHFVERRVPVSYGSGQGIGISGNRIYWADRVANEVWQCDDVGTGNGDLTMIQFWTNGVPTLAQEGFCSQLNPTANTASLLIGARGDSSSPYKGWIKNVNIWGRALVTNEVSSVWTRDQ